MAFIPPHKTEGLLMFKRARLLKRQQGQQIYTLMLGLFLILLAFFILLNAISSPKEDRISQVSSSLASGFGFGSGALSPVQAENTLIAQHELALQRLVTLFETELPEGANLQGVGDLATFIFLRTEDFFDESAIKVRPIRARFFKEMAAILKQQTSVKITLSVDIPLSQEFVDNLQASALRAAKFARLLVRAGFPSQQFSVHVQEQKSPFITLRLKTALKEEGQ